MPFGENPFGDGFVGDESFGNGLGDHEDREDQRVTEERDNYVPASVTKRPSSSGKKTKGNPAVMVVLLIGVAVFAILLIMNGRKAASKETVTHLQKGYDILEDGAKKIGHRDEDIVIYATGDVVTRLTLTYTWEIQPGRSAAPSAAFQKSLLPFDFITYDKVRSGYTIWETADFNHVDVEENFNAVVGNDFFEFDKGKKLSPSGNHYSLKRAIQELKAMGYQVVEPEQEGQ